MTHSEQAKFLRQAPRSQVVTKTDLAKAHNAWAQKPHIVSKGSQANFSEFADWVADNWTDDSNTRFNDQFYRDTIAKLIVYRQLERDVSVAKWYVGGYRANIVCYAIALMQHLIDMYYPYYVVDWSTIWARQNVPQVLSDQLMQLAAVVQGVITQPPAGSANVTQWCKQVACWEAVKRAPAVLDSTLEVALATQEDVHSAKKATKKDQAAANELALQATVMELGPDYWKSLARFALERSITTPAVLTPLTIACEVPAKVPSPKQCKLLMQFRDRAAQEGWRPVATSMARP